MKASVYTNYGAPEVLQYKEVEKPTPKDNEVLVKVHAATVNRSDCAMLRAKPFIMRFGTGMLKPKNPILGTDFAGMIEAIGKNVTSFKVGEKVFGFDDRGLSSHAQYLTLSVKKAITIMPTNSTYKQATASIEGAHYAYNFMNKVELKKGQKVLVNGATGAIGSAMVQLLKYFGAHITAVCTAKNFELVTSLGANKVIDYEKEDFTNSSEKFHYVFDAVGKSSFGKCKSILKPHGVYMSSELGFMSQNLFFALITALFGNLPGHALKKVKFPYPPNILRSVLLIKKLMIEGKFKPVIDREYSLEQIAKAFNYVEKGQKIGNVIILINSDDEV